MKVMRRRWCRCCHREPISPAPSLDVRALRNRSQLTQVEFAQRLGVPLDTIRNWEQGKREPRGPARALLTLIARAPDLTFALLAKASSAH